MNSTKGKFSTIGAVLILVAGMAVSLFLLSDEGTAGNSTSSSSFFVAQFGHGVANGNRFSSEINFINLSTTTSQVFIQTFNDAGDPDNLLSIQLSPTTPNVSDSENEIDVPGRGTARQLSLNGNSETELDLGWAQITTQQAVGVSVIFNIVDPDGNLTSTDVRVGPIVTAASFFGIVNPQAKTGVALLNPPGNATANVTLIFFGSGGNQVGNAGVTLPAGTKLSQFLNEFLTSLQNFDGSVEVRSNVPIAILPLRQEGNVLTTQSLFPPRQVDN